MAAPPPSRQRSPSPPSWWFWCCAWLGSPPCRCRCGVSMPPVRRPVLPLAATMGTRPKPPTTSPRSARTLICVKRVGGWLRRSPPTRCCCRVSPSGRTCWRRSSRVRADRGSATLVAVAVMAVLLAVTIGGSYLASAVIARHRAQAARRSGRFGCGGATTRWQRRRLRRGIADCGRDGGRCCRLRGGRA